MWPFSCKKTNEWIKAAKRCRELQDFDGCLTAINAAGQSYEARAYYALLMDLDAEFRSFVSDLQNGVRTLEYCSALHGEVQKGLTPQLLVLWAKQKLDTPALLEQESHAGADNSSKSTSVKQNGLARHRKSSARSRRGFHFSMVFWPVLGAIALLPAGWVNYLCWETDGVGLKILAVAAGIGSAVASIECFLKASDFRIGRIIYIVLSVGMVVVGLLYEGLMYGANVPQIFCAYYIATAAFAALCSALTDNEDRFVGFSLYSDILVLLGVFVTGHWIAGTLMAVLGFVRLAATSAGRSWGIRAMPFIFIVAGIFAWQGCFFWMLGCCVALLGILFHEY